LFKLWTRRKENADGMDLKVTIGKKPFRALLVIFVTWSWCPKVTSFRKHNLF